MQGCHKFAAQVRNYYMGLLIVITDLACSYYFVESMPNKNIRAIKRALPSKVESIVATTNKTMQGPIMKLRPDGWENTTINLLKQLHVEETEDQYHMQTLWLR